ncbi:cofactor for methionyl [Coccidioides immitis RS]|uniref:Cofactor for methionyl n=2 Tax=Coccidioides immitis TaxID=5501 RepID=J3KGQ8_COCIM|nr:cofactor for methionyl [Coccidioides immitis RS]EAS34956.3 cofactor for methionyl [Coccidioides immitis RS]TPX26744.1 G4 quadruplex nucleic acid binding protein [Coccidioides immitis]
MATASAPATSLLSLLYRSYPRVVPSNSTEPDLESISPKIFPTADYTDAEKAEINQWLSRSSELAQALKKGEIESVSTLLITVNTHLASRTTVLGAKPSVADVALYALLGPVVEKWSPEERTGEDGYHHIVRHVDLVQNAPLFSLQIPEEEKIKIDVNDVRAAPRVVVAKDENNKKKREKKGGRVGEKDLVVGRGKNADKNEANIPVVDVAKDKAVAGAIAAGAPKKEKKEKKPKQPKAPAPAAPLSPSLIDLRVGHILRAINHPNADSLYVSTIACGDAPGTEHTTQDEATGLTVRTVCSGLNGLVPLEEMQGRKVVTVCNLKPVTMRGIKSAAMVLAASPKNDESHAGPVELVSPPEGAEAGERVFFEGWNNGDPEKVLNPKKKIWETFQPGFTTTDSLEVAFDSSAVPQLNSGGETSTAPSTPSVGKLVTKSGGVCTVKSLKGAAVR